MRQQFKIFAVLVIILAAIGIWVPQLLWLQLALTPLLIIGLYDFFQTKHAIRRNFPVFGRLRYVFETIRPEIHQYFVESDTDGTPFDREERSLIYQRAKAVRDTVPFGTRDDVYAEGYEWVNHSLAAKHVDSSSLRVTIGGRDCKQPYDASILNISAMSYGSLSKEAVLALSGGASMGGFAHNTGEGGLSPYHLEGGADIIWQIGTGYFGCRTADGNFDPVSYAQTSKNPQVKMIELKLSQGAKPGHGGILPASKLTLEISEIRLVNMGKDVISPPNHATFDGPTGLLEFIAQLRDLSGGKPVGFKLCIGKRREFISICKAMVKTGILPDFITIDGGEGGTGAAPLEFTKHMGSPLIEGLIFAHNVLTGFGLRDEIRIIASGKVTSGFSLVKRLALGADLCSSARGMMMALGCIQALKCNSNHCPVGVATQDPNLRAGLVPSDKKVRVYNFHHETVESVSEMMGAMGLMHSADIKPWHVIRRISQHEVKHYGEIYNYLKPSDLLDENNLPDDYRRSWLAAGVDSFDHANPDFEMQ